MKKEKETKQNPTHSTLNNTLWVFRRQWKYARLSFVLLLIMIPVNITVQFLGIFLPKVVVANVTAEYDFLNILLPIGVIVGGLFILNAATNGINVLNFAYFSRFREAMNYELNMKNMTVEYQTAESAKFRNMSNRAQETLWASGMHGPLTQLSQSATEFVRNILGYLFFGTIISFISPWIAVVLTLTPIFNYFFTRRYNRYEYANRNNWTPIDRKLSYIVSKSADFGSAKDIRIYGLNTWFSETYKTLTKERLSWDKKLLKKSFAINLADLVVILLRDGLAYFILISMTLRGEITVDNFVLYFAAIGSFATWVGGIISKWNEVNSISLIICDLRDVVEWRDDTNRGKGINVAGISTPCDIEINNMSFRYGRAEADTLKKINLHIHPGEKIAVVGMNGAGKTTLIKNICGLYTPASGEIRVSGHIKNEFIINDYYSLFSVVFQNFDILCVSIAEIVSSKTSAEADRERVCECLKLAGLWDKVSSLPDGIDTPLNKQIYKNGVDLSGGEKQKLTLAKAIYKNAPILILDEPTASLDPIAENQMYLQYNALTADKTSIYISHRLSSTRFCDRIIFLENGQIIEEGTHSELMKNGGKYAEMFEIQSHYYKDGVAV